MRNMLLALMKALQRRKHPVLVTRLSPEKGEALSRQYPRGRYYPEARIFEIRSGRARAGKAPVVTAGTPDAPVAEEAAGTPQAPGCTVAPISGVGGAGITRR